MSGSYMYWAGSYACWASVLSLRYCKGTKKIPYAKIILETLTTVLIFFNAIV